jgi:predicted nucleic acid-binding protein
MIFDTTFLIDLEREVSRGQEGAASVFLARNKEQMLRISVITIGELAEGYGEAASAELGELIAPYGIAEITYPVALRYALISRSLRLQGNRWGDNDIWIGATALELGEPLVTRNREHFSRIAGLISLGY